MPPANEQDNQPTTDSVAVDGAPLAPEDPSTSTEAPTPPPAPAESIVPPTVPVTPLPASSEPAAAESSASSVVVGSQPTIDHATPVTGTPGAVVIGGKRRRFSKKVLGIVAVVVLVLLLAGGYVFGYYLPNQPTNMWNSALVNTGKAYDKLTTYATTQPAAKAWTTDGSFKLKGAVVADGTFSGKSVGANGELTGSLSASGLKLDLDVRTIKSSGDTPDLYFKVDGLQGLGSLLGGGQSNLGGVLNGVNNQWFFIDHTLFEQLGQSASDTQITQGDVSKFLKDVGTPSKQYLFTSDTSKAAIVVKQQIGREKLDGRSVYHYKIGINKQNLQAYAKALCTSVKNDKIGKLLVTNSSNDCTSVQNQFAAANTTGTADAWVDTHTKLIHTIRFTDKSDSSNYFDISQDYQGGDSYPLTLAFHSKSGGTTSKGSLKLVLNAVTNDIDVTGQFQSTGSSSADNETGSLSLTIKPSNDTSLKVDKPAGAKNLLELINGLGLGQLFAGSASTSTQGSAADVERQTDLKTLQSQLEASFANNGVYPTIADLNNSTWRKSNMQGLNNATLQDPAGSSATLGSVPATHVYAYQATSDSGGSCDNHAINCTKYKLIATLDDGSHYELDSLN